MRFRISYRNGAYYVSVPNYDGGEVVTVDELRKERLKALKDAAKDVCTHCGQRNLIFERVVIRGVAGSGNWVHRHKASAIPDNRVLCDASAIWSRILFEYDERALLDDSGEQGE